MLHSYRTEDFMPNFGKNSNEVARFAVFQEGLPFIFEGMFDRMRATQLWISDCLTI
jgi:hypothetical protein